MEPSRKDSNGTFFYLLNMTLSTTESNILIQTQIRMSVTGHFSLAKDGLLYSRNKIVCCESEGQSKRQRETGRESDKHKQ